VPIPHSIEGTREFARSHAPTCVSTNDFRDLPLRQRLTCHDDEVDWLKVGFEGANPFLGEMQELSQRDT